MLGRKTQARNGGTGQVQASKATVPQVVCEGCGKKFAIELKERPLAGGGVQQRFQCPHCKKYYVVANISAKGVQIRQELKGIEAQLQGKPGDEGLVAEMERLKGELAPEVTKATPP